MARKKLNYAQTHCVKTAGLIMQQTGQLRPGARVGVAVSGGVDSFTMLKVLTIRRRIVPFPVELMVLHVNAGFDPHEHAPLVEWVKKEGLAAHFEVTSHGPDAHSDKNRKRSPCFYCSWNRRKRFFELCRHYGLTHLALGHTAEDLVANFFMNIFQNGRVEGLSSRELFFGGELTLIRPMLLLEKSVITRAARAWGLPIWQNRCPSAGETNRDRTLAWVSERFAGNRKEKNAVFSAVTRRQLDLDRVIH